MTKKDISAQEARLVEAYRSILERDPWLADMVMETVLDVARTSSINGSELRAAASPAPLARKT